jgi:membrane-bound ClpP family serine protease
VIVGVTALTAGYMLFILFVVVRWRHRVGATLGRSTGPVVPIGSVAEVRSGLLPVGVVYLAGEEWSARTEDGVALGAGTPVRVVRQDGLTLIVEPTERGPRSPEGGIA